MIELLINGQSVGIASDLMIDTERDDLRILDYVDPIRSVVRRTSVELQMSDLSRLRQFIRPSLTKQELDFYRGPVKAAANRLIERRDTLILAGHDEWARDSDELIARLGQLQRRLEDLAE